MMNVIVLLGMLAVIGGMFVGIGALFAFALGIPLLKGCVLSVALGIVTAGAQA